MAGHDESKSPDHGDGGEHKKHKKHHAHGAHAEHEHEEGWIVSFADNVLLMMGFFVILLAMNMGPKGSSAGEPGETAEDRLLDVAIAVREAFHNPVSMGSMVPDDQPLVRRLKTRQSKGEAKPTATEPAKQSTPAVRPTDWAGDGGFVQFTEKDILLDKDAKETIAQIATRIAGTRWMVEVRGHASKWETWRDTKKARDLAYQRAWAVGNELVANRVSWDQIRLVSSGDSAPIIAKARTASEAQTNQRTEILILNEATPADPYSNAPVPPTEGD
jgi:outer membrane protein OmpA-like peptidoglycan-associated protein